MIAGIFFEGSGIGNQLARYVMTRVLAADKGYKYEMLNPQLFKGAGFMNIELCNALTEQAVVDVNRYKHWKEKMVVENGIDIRGYDPEINFVEDNTVIEGEFQDERYFEHRLSEIKEWLSVEPLEIPDNICIINFRGGEYTSIPDLFLPKEYWYDAMKDMIALRPDIEFEVHTDDTITARQFFPSLKVIDNEVIGHSLNTNMGYNWRALRYAKHAIISNSSFAILPRLIRHLDDAVTIAPRYWARRNTGIWALPQNFYKSFLYI